MTGSTPSASPGAAAWPNSWRSRTPVAADVVVLVSTGTGMLMVPARPGVLSKMITPRRYQDPAYAQAIAAELYGGLMRRRPDELRHVVHERERLGSQDRVRPAAPRRRRLDEPARTTAHPAAHPRPRRERRPPHPAGECADHARAAAPRHAARLRRRPPRAAHLGRRARPARLEVPDLPSGCPGDASGAASPRRFRPLRHRDGGCRVVEAELRHQTRVSSPVRPSETPKTNLSCRSTSTEPRAGRPQPRGQGAGGVLDVDHPAAQVVVGLALGAPAGGVQRREGRVHAFSRPGIRAEHVTGVDADADHGPAGAHGRRPRRTGRPS